MSSSPRNYQGAGVTVTRWFKTPRRLGCIWRFPGCPTGWHDPIPLEQSVSVEVSVPADVFARLAGGRGHPATPPDNVLAELIPVRGERLRPRSPGGCFLSCVHSSSSMVKISSVLRRMRGSPAYPYDHPSYDVEMLAQHLCVPDPWPHSGGGPVLHRGIPQGPRLGETLVLGQQAGPSGNPRGIRLPRQGARQVERGQAGEGRRCQPGYRLDPGHP